MSLHNKPIGLYPGDDDTPSDSPITVNELKSIDNVHPTMIAIEAMALAKLARANFDNGWDTCIRTIRESVVNGKGQELLLLLADEHFTFPPARPNVLYVDPVQLDDPYGTEEAHASSP